MFIRNKKIDPEQPTGLPSQLAFLLPGAVAIFRPMFWAMGMFSAMFMAALVLSACAGHTPISDDESGIATAPQQQDLDGDLLFQLLAGEFAGNLGDLDTAVDYYQRAASQTFDPRVVSRATYIALYSKNYERARELLVRWLELAPDDQNAIRMYAITYLKLKQPQQAATYIQKILDASEDTDEQKALAVKRLLQKESNIDDGLVVLESLNQSDPDNIHMLILQSRFAAQLNEYEPALALLDRVLELDPQQGDVYFIKAKILIAQDRRDDALALLVSAVDEQPTNTHLRMQYARLLVEAGNFDEAREQFLILYEQDPESPEILLSLGLQHIESKQLDEAEKYLLQLIALDKKVDVAHYYLGRIAQNRKQPKIAISHYTKVEQGDYVLEAKLRIAGMHNQLGRGEEALRELEELADQQELWPNRVRVYLAQGEVLRHMQRYQQALELYNRALIQNPEDSDLLYARALVAEKIDRLDITESDLRKVLSTEPENVNALNALGYTLADRTERLQEALKYIQRAAELVPDDPAILDSLGWVSYRLGKLQDALKWLQLAFEKLEDAEIAAHYGEVLWKSNQHEKAEQVWQRGRELNPDHPVLVETIQRFLQ